MAFASNMETDKSRWLFIEMARVWMLLADTTDFVSPPLVQPTVQQQQQRQAKSDRQDE
jgi:hypothetical protein